MKSIVDEIVRQAEARLDWLREQLDADPDNCDLAGRVMEADHNVANVRQAQEVMNAELAGKRDLFHEHTPECGHTITLPETYATLTEL